MVWATELSHALRLFWKLGFTTLGAEPFKLPQDFCPLVHKNILCVCDGQYQYRSLIKIYARTFTVLLIRVDARCLLVVTCIQA